VLNDVLTNVGNVIAKGRLGPGQMVVANLADGSFKTNTQVAQDAAAEHPYGTPPPHSHRSAPCFARKLASLAPCTAQSASPPARAPHHAPSLAPSRAPPDLPPSQRSS